MKDGQIFESKDTHKRRGLAVIKVNKQRVSRVAWKIRRPMRSFKKLNERVKIGMKGNVVDKGDMFIQNNLATVTFKIGPRS